MRLRVLDLFSGLGGFSQAFRDRGHYVVAVDINKAMPADIIADVRYLPIRGKWDVVLASPPCTEFSVRAMPWHAWKHPEPPDLSLVHATLQAIKTLKPRYWVIENVQGAIRWLKPVLGRYRQRCGSRYLWGNFPKFRCIHEKCYGKWRLPPSEARAAVRSKIPYEISYKLCIAIESAMKFRLVAHNH